MQTTSHILMIRPVHFTFNAQTAVNNAFQQSGSELDAQEKALEEFDRFVNILRAHHIDVLVVNDTIEPHTPDSIFPNNWVSFHNDGTMVMYPMYAENRRMERKPSVLKEIQERFTVEKIVDLTRFENIHQYLEGTGSMVLDRDKKIAYACLSPRTDKALLEQFCDEMNYQPVVFDAVDKNGRAIYHTNVMMCVADQFVVICTDSIPNENERNQVSKAIEASGKELISISLNQMNEFAGNMLQVNNREGKKFLVMSSRAYESLTAGQIAKLEKFNPILHSSLDSIERNGGGSARCMMAEVHLPFKK